MKYVLIIAAVGVGIIVVANAMSPQPSVWSQLAQGGISGLVNGIKGWTTSSSSSTPPLQSTDPSATPSCSGAWFGCATARTVAGQVPYGTTSTGDGEAAISDAMGVMSARASQVPPNLFQTRKQVVFSGGALGASPFAQRS